jgi:hypothetical protein
VYCHVMELRDHFDGPWPDQVVNRGSAVGAGVLVCVWRGEAEGQLAYHTTAYHTSAYHTTWCDGGGGFSRDGLVGLKWGVWPSW